MPENNSRREQRDARGEGAVEPTRCDACGAVIDCAAWHPVAARFDDDGEFHLFTFCSVECRHVWADD